MAYHQRYVQSFEECQWSYQEHNQIPNVLSKVDWTCFQAGRWKTTRPKDFFKWSDDIASDETYYSKTEKAKLLVDSSGLNSSNYSVIT